MRTNSLFTLFVMPAAAGTVQAERGSAWEDRAGAVAANATDPVNAIAPGIHRLRCSNIDARETQFGRRDVHDRATLRLLNVAELR